MRFVAASASILSLALLMPAPGHCAIDEKVPDAQSLLALQTRASSAGPREQCFLYAELVHQMTELAARQRAAAQALGRAGVGDPIGGVVGGFGGGM